MSDTSAEVDDIPEVPGGFPVSCTLCPEKLGVERYRGTATPPFPKWWWCDAVHDHSQEPPQWKLVVYYREPRGRFPEPVKELREMKAENKRTLTAGRQLVNDSRPKRGGNAG